MTETELNKALAEVMGYVKIPETELGHYWRNKAGELLLTSTDEKDNNFYEHPAIFAECVEWLRENDIKGLIFALTGNPLDQEPYNLFKAIALARIAAGKEEG